MNTNWRTALDSARSCPQGSRYTNPLGCTIMNYFYLDEQNREIGPVSLENLKSFRAAGVIRDQTLVHAENGGPLTACVAIVGSVETPGATNLQSQTLRVVSEAMKDAKAALLLLARDPVGGLAPTYQKLGHKGAGAAGTVFMAVYTLVGAMLLARLLNSLSSGMITLGFSIKILIATAGSPAAWFGSLALARVLNHRGGQWQGDAFIAGAVSLVWGAGLLLAALVGWKNIEVWGIVALAVICITVLQVFVGLTRISGLTEPRATLAVPILLVVDAWFTKIIFTAVYR